MTWRRRDPGACPICGAAHSSCHANSVIAIEQLPATAAAPPPPAPDLVADAIQATLPPGQYTTATYRGRGRKKAAGA